MLRTDPRSKLAPIFQQLELEQTPLPALERKKEKRQNTQNKKDPAPLGKKKTKENKN